VISRLFALLVSLKFFTSLEMSRVCANLEPATSLQAQPDDATIATIERLLAAIDRLRVERDDLRRDVQFLETESRFAIESLEAKLSASVSTVTSRGAMEVTQSRRIVERSALVATASAVVIRHLDFRYSQLQEELRITQNQCADWQSQLQVKNQTIEQQTDKIHALEVQLGVSMSNLHGLCKQRDDIESNFTQRELQWEEERQRINRLNQNNLEELGRQVQELSRTLENVEYERDSLALQATNLTSELHSTKQELANGESRYSSLQFQQLSTMSASEANRVLRDQLKEMEMRIARRTEQIGIHQHDIRRLETNLRLQEERLNEMTVELETLAAQKAAMVEDCADAREARDAALSRVETLEMELEALDGKSEQSDQALISLVAVFMETVSQAKNRMNEMRAKDANTTDELRAVYDHQQTLLRVSEDDKRSLAALQQCLQDSDVEIRQMGIALAMSRTEVTTVVDVFDRLKEEKGGAEARFRHLSTDIEQYEDRYASVLAELEISRLETTQHTHRIADLEASHQQTLQELAETHETYKGELARLCDEAREAKERLEKDLAALDSERLQALAESSQNAKQLQTELEQINEDRLQERTGHDQQMGHIETQLQTAETALEELKDKMRCVTRELDESHAELGSLRRERLSLQESMTNLEAELQRSISMTRFLESKFKEWQA
jgi:chromosome segregation ATPase